MADGDGAQGDLLGGDKGAAGGASSGAAAGAAAGAGAASGAAAAAGGDDAAKVAATEAARVAALTPEQKAIEAKAVTDKAAADKAAADAAAKPADYTKLKMPEGYKTDPADPVFGAALKLFGDNKIAPDVAQKLMDFTVERDKEVAKGINDANVAAWTKQADGWKAETAKTHSAEDLGIAKTAFAKVFDAETAKYLEGLRYTEHPGFVAAMVKIGKAIKDDTFVAGNAVANGAGSDARKAFPNSNMNP